MRAVIVYESMYGNTRAVAGAIGDGLRTGFDHVVVVPVGEADDVVLADTDLLVVGGPTHAWGMSRASTRTSAAGTSGGGRVLEPDPARAGLREWFTARGPLAAHVAAFDTRRSGPAVLTGRASVRIDRQLQRHGSTPVVPAESFLVTKQDQLVTGERERARAWGAALAASTLEAAAR